MLAGIILWLLYIVQGLEPETIIYADCVVCALSGIVRHTLYNAAHFSLQSQSQLKYDLRSLSLQTASLAAACCLAVQVCCALVSGILNTVNIHMFTKQLHPKRRKSLLSFYVKLAWIHFECDGLFFFFSCFFFWSITTPQVERKWWLECRW